MTIGRSGFVVGQPRMIGFVPIRRSVVGAAADVRAVAAHAGGHAVLLRALEHLVIHAVDRRDAGAAAAVEHEGAFLVAHALEVGLRNEGVGHVLAQIDAQTGQAVGIRAGEVGVGHDLGQIVRVDLLDVQRLAKAADELFFLLKRKMDHNNYLQF